MKNTTIITVAALLAAGTALANATDYTVTLDSTYYTNPNAWVYVWSGATDTTWNGDGNWGILKKLTDASLVTGQTNKPTKSDPAFIGYTFSYENGVQILTSTNDSVVVTGALSWFGASTRIYLGSNAKLVGSSNAFSASETATFNFGNFDGSAIVEMADFWMQTSARVNFEGNVQMSGDSFSYTLFSSSSMKQMAGSWSASSISVTDANGVELIYTEDDSLKGTSGYYWLECSEFVQNAAYSVVLKAAASIPEPSAFGLLAGLGALALAGTRRRRRK